MTGFGGSLADLQGWLLLPMILAAIGLSALAVGDLLGNRRSANRRRLSPDGEDALAAAVSARFGAEGAFQRLVVAPLKDRLVPKEGKDLNGIKLRLIQSGFYSPHAVPAYFVIRLLLGGGVPLLASPMLGLVTGDLTVPQVVSVNLVLAALGYCLPAFSLSRRIASRQQRIREGFPDVLDLLIICVEAGLGLDAAVARVGQEIAAAHPLLGEHLGLMAAELRAGKTREEAWRSMSSRIGITEVSSLVTLLVQTETLGASAADALRAHAADQRGRRMLKAEEKAQKLAVKMTFPLILPALIIVIATPPIIRALGTTVHSQDK